MRVDCVSDSQRNKLNDNGDILYEICARYAERAL
ncbi:MAG: hypothetical protein ACJAUZ_002012, partial [Flavobacteriaceae bacterium]